MKEIQPLKSRILILNWLKNQSLHFLISITNNNMKKVRDFLLVEIRHKSLMMPRILIFKHLLHDYLSFLTLYYKDLLF